MRNRRDEREARVELVRLVCLIHSKNKRDQPIRALLVLQVTDRQTAGATP
jgi:hypothetical protein